MPAPEPAIEVEILYYKEGQIGAVPVPSVTFDPTTGRRRILGHLANHDRVYVPIDDVIANPGVFLAPCEKPYIISGRSVTNPCEESVGEVETTSFSKELEALGETASPTLISLEEAALIGIVGDTATKALQEHGYYTWAEARALSDPELTDIIGPKALAKLRKSSDPFPDGEAELVMPFDDEMVEEAVVDKKPVKRTATRARGRT